MKALVLAKESLKTQQNGLTGKLIGVQEQIVSGVNYKMTFETTSGQY